MEKIEVGLWVFHGIAKGPLRIELPEIAPNACMDGHWNIQLPSDFHRLPEKEIRQRINRMASPSCRESVENLEHIRLTGLGSLV